VEQAIRKALSDDEMVNGATVRNYLVAEQRLDQAKLKGRAVELYQSVLREGSAQP
jgi:hypothetical protein